MSKFMTLHRRVSKLERHLRDFSDLNKRLKLKDLEFSEFTFCRKKEKKIDSRSSVVRAFELCDR